MRTKFPNLRDKTIEQQFNHILEAERLKFSLIAYTSDEQEEGQELDIDAQQTLSELIQKAGVKPRHYRIEVNFLRIPFWLELKKLNSAI